MPQRRCAFSCRNYYRKEIFYGKATVYFTNELTPEAVVKMYRQLGVDLPGKVAVKVHSGEDGNQNYLHPEFMKPIIDAVNGTVVECNTAYGGARNETPSTSS